MPRSKGESFLLAARWLFFSYARLSRLLCSQAGSATELNSQIWFTRRSSKSVPSPGDRTLVLHAPVSS